MTERLGAVAYRHLAARAVLTGFGDGDSLQNIVTDPLNDGCLCYVVSEKAYYLLDRRSTAAPVPGFIVDPLAGPGRWILFAEAAAARSRAIIQFTAANGGAVVDIINALEWKGFSVGGGFQCFISTPGLFLCDLTNGDLTYQGPSQDYDANVYASMATIAQADIVEATVDLNGDFLNTMNDSADAQRASIPLDSAVVQIAAFRGVALSFNDKVRTVFRNLTDSNDITVTHYTLVLEASS
jgi:hypothetical protein